MAGDNHCVVCHIAADNRLSVQASHFADTVVRRGVGIAVGRHGIYGYLLYALCPSGRELRIGGIEPPHRCSYAVGRHRFGCNGDACDFSRRIVGALVGQNPIAGAIRFVKTADKRCTTGSCRMAVHLWLCRGCDAVMPKTCEKVLKRFV